MIVITHDPWVARHARRRIQIADGVIVADEQLDDTSVARRPASSQAQAGAGPGVAFDLAEAVRMAFGPLRVNLSTTW